MDVVDQKLYRNDTLYPETGLFVNVHILFIILTAV